MSFQVKVKNLGKLTDATVRIGKFTVFAGPNNTGKSFVSKALYSIFGAMNANHLAVVVNDPLNNLSGSLDRMGNQEEFVSESIKCMTIELDGLRSIINHVVSRGDTDELGGIKKALPDIHAKLDKIKEISVALKSECENFVKSEYTEDEDDTWIDNDEITRMVEGVATLYALLKDEAPVKFIESGLRHEIRNNLIQNFQIAKLRDLQSKEYNIAFNIESVGNIEIVDDNIKLQNVTFQGIHQLQKHSRVLYLESPVFFRLRDALMMDGMPGWFLFHARKQLSGVPKYFYDLDKALNTSYIGDVEFPEILDMLTGGDVLGGRIERDKGGDLFFQEEKGGKCPLSLAAMGVANLGMLALLIEKNLLDKNTFLFIDEPEAHLHPAWQVEMAKALFALAEKGVNIVIATHSAEILKWLEVHLLENPKDEELVALNHFGRDGVKTNGAGLTERLNAVQKELAGPYYKLYFQGVV